MGKKKHAREIDQLHKGQNKGCIWSHEGGYGSYRTTECHYRKQGFEASAGRTGMYNDKDHHANAVALKYAKWASDAEDSIVRTGGAGSQIEADLKAGAGKRKGSALNRFLKKFQRKYNDSLRWLEYDAKGWHYGFNHAAHKVNKKSCDTFKPKDKDTYAHGAWYPYHHEYHHLIAVSALRKYVITDKKVTRRIKLLLSTGWNINKGDNIVCLPTELWVAAITELPAHCPWDAMDHPAYSKSLKEKLQSTRKMLDDAVKGDKDCEEEMKKLNQMLTKVSEQLLKSIKKHAGRTLGAV